MSEFKRQCNIIINEMVDPNQAEVISLDAVQPYLDQYKADSSRENKVYNDGENRGGLFNLASWATQLAEFLENSRSASRLVDRISELRYFSKTLLLVLEAALQDMYIPEEEGRQITNQLKEWGLADSDQFQQILDAMTRSTYQMTKNGQI